MTQNSLQQNDGIVKTSNRLQYLQLHIQSRNDVENNFKTDLGQDMKPQFSWQIHNSQISEKQEQRSSRLLKINQTDEQNEVPLQMHPDYTQQNIIDSKVNDNKYEQEILKQESKQHIRNITKLNNSPQIHQKSYKMNERQTQILYNKEISNGIYLRTQIQELMRLTAFSLLLEEQKQLKSRIYEISTQIRKQKIRSISTKRYEKQKKQETYIKTAPRIQQLQRQIREAKTKSNKFGTRLALLQNYLKVNENPSRREKSHKRSSTQYQSAKSPIAPCQQNSSRVRSSKLKIYHNNNQHRLGSSYLSPNSREIYNSTKSIPISDHQGKSDTCLLKQYKQILKQTIDDQKDYITKKIQTLNKQKLNLKKQIQSIKMNIIKVSNQLRRFKASSGSSLRRISRLQRSNRQFSSPKLSKSPFMSKNLNSQKNWHLKGKINHNAGSLDVRSYKNSQYEHLHEDNQEVNQNVFNSYLKYNISNENWTQSRRVDRDRDQDIVGQEIRNQYFNS